MAGCAIIGKPSGNSSLTKQAISPIANTCLNPFTWLNSLTNIRLLLVINSSASKPFMVAPFTPAAQTRVAVSKVKSVFVVTVLPS